MIDDIPINDKTILLTLARTSIENSFKKLDTPIKPEGSAIFDEHFGAFVTLHKHGNLRGCIGFIEGIGPLWETVRNLALKSAFEDPRFPSLTESELGECDIEISVLTPLEVCPDPEKIEIGKHGLYIRKGFYSGLLLPQVPTEWGWNREEFLQHTCNKAGLPENSWKDDNSELFWFSAIVFSEN
ncbi:MAG: AmmeMemoRadiSam system protein A [Planctomycetes bacterium]|nr:AmmeMemoRadiSam system protein A [Planctomycetota bacterium]